MFTMEQEIEQIVKYIIVLFKYKKDVVISDDSVKNAVIADALDSGSIISERQVDTLFGEIDDEHAMTSTNYSNLYDLIQGSS
jgi:O-phosphoseryl-tRNA(Cys) synthetase